MLLVKTSLRTSSIEGFGVFAEEFIPAGTKIGEWNSKLDQTIPARLVESLPTLGQETIRRYAYREGPYYKLNFDNMRFFNHSDDPNTRQTLTSDFATRDIQIGEEITCDYHTFDHEASQKLGVVS